MILKQSSPTDQFERNFSISPASELTGGGELWMPSNAYYSRLQKYGPLVLRISMPMTQGEERLLGEWIMHLKGTYPLFIPMGNSTPLQLLFNTYRRCNKSHKENRCITIALSLPRNDPAALGKTPPVIDEISRRQVLANFNFMGLSFYVQQFCVLCRKVISDPRYTPPEAYHFVAAVETFTRDVYSLLSEDALKAIDTFWSMPLESHQTAEAILNNPAWNELRNGLINQLLSLGGVIDAIYRLNNEDKTLDSLAHTGYLLAKLMLEEINNSATRRKEDLPLEWDIKALLWQAISMRLKLIPVVLGRDHPGFADILFGFFTASGSVMERLGDDAHYHMILQWSDLKHHWQDIVEHKGIEEAAAWIQKVKQHPQGDLSKGVVGLTEIQDAFYQALEEQTHHYIGVQRTQNNSSGVAHSGMPQLLPAFARDDRGNIHPFEVSPQVNAIFGSSH